jgi:hypothetical protein
MSLAESDSFKHTNGGKDRKVKSQLETCGIIKQTDTGTIQVLVVF